MTQHELLAIVVNKKFHIFVGLSLIGLGVWDSNVYFPWIITNLNHFYDLFVNCSGGFPCRDYRFAFLGAPVVIAFYFIVGSIFILSSLRS